VNAGKLVALALLGCACVPATAGAATLSNANGRMVYTDAPGADTTVEFEPQAGSVYVGPFTGTATGCSKVGTQQVLCPAAGELTADFGDGDDTAWVPRELRSSLYGGPGDDRLVVLIPAAATISGGPGLDTALLQRSDGQPVEASLGGVADGGAQAIIASDVENLSVYTTGRATLTGDGGANDLTSYDGDDVLTGGAGSDVLSSGAGADRLMAIDGEVDRVECGAGNDTAVVDAVDSVGDSCENVVVGRFSAPVDLPPQVAFKAGETFEVAAYDDRAVVSVRFLSGDKTLCTATAAPFRCAFNATVDDVGRKTIVAVAVDSAGQSATAIRTLTISRFIPDSLSLAVKRQGKRYVATGKLALPAGVPCTGEVAVAVGRTTRSGKLSRTCTYKVTLPSGGRFVATYGGTRAIESLRSAARTVR